MRNKVSRQEANRKHKCKPNWQKGFKKAMLCNRGFDKIMSFIGRGIAVQQVRNAKAGV